jgi:hypothetical protein
MAYLWGKQTGVGQLPAQFWSISLDCHGHVLGTDLGILWNQYIDVPTASVDLLFNLLNL